MPDLIAITVAAALVDQLLLRQAALPAHLHDVDLTRRAAILATATAIVLIAAAALAAVLQWLFIEPLGLAPARLLLLTLLAAAFGGAAEFWLRRRRPRLGETLGAGLPLIAGNAAVLAVLVHVTTAAAPLAMLSTAVALALGFALALVALCSLEERLDASALPGAMRGLPILLINAALMMLALEGLAGMRL